MTRPHRIAIICLISLALAVAVVAQLDRKWYLNYLDGVERMGEGWIDPDTYRSAGSWTAAVLADGAVCRALDACRDGRIGRAFCAVRPPGHHAEPSRGMGFCLVNNAAVGARYAQRLGYARVMIADFNVHHD